MNALAAKNADAAATTAMASGETRRRARVCAGGGRAPALHPDLSACLIAAAASPKTSSAALPSVGSAFHAAKASGPH